MRRPNVLARRMRPPGDFDIIGTAFHKWVRDHAVDIGLQEKNEYRRFIERDFIHLSNRYLELLGAGNEVKCGPVFYNFHNGFTLQLPVILAAITPDDDDATFREKSALVAGALDIFVARRMVNFRFFGYSTVVYTMFNLMKEVRNRDIPQIKKVLTEWLGGETERFDGVLELFVHQRNRRNIHYLLARMTAWLASQLKRSTTVTRYLNKENSRKTSHPYEVEHIWAVHYESHKHEFESPLDFEAYRNKIGALLLLPKDFNASFGDMSYRDKVKHYNSQNPLARSLHPLAYKNNPSFRRLIKTYGLPFEPYPEEFTKANVDARQELYRRLAEVVWDPARIGL